MPDSSPISKTSQNGQDASAAPSALRSPVRWLKRWVRRDAGRHLYLRNLWQERRLLAVVVLTSLAAAVLELAGISLLVPFLDNLTDPSSTPLQTGVGWVDTWLLGIGSSALGRLYRISGLILLSIWLRAFFNYLSNLVSTKMREAIMHRLRRQVIDQYHRVSLRFFAKRQAGELIDMVTTQVQQRMRRLFEVSSQILLNVFLMLAYATAVVLLSWKLALFALVFCGALFGGLTYFMRLLRSQGREVYHTDQRLTSTVAELINGVRTVMAFGTREHEAQRFAAVSRASAEANVEATRRSAKVGPLSQGIASTGLILLVVVAVQFFVLDAEMSAAVLLTFFFALLRMLPIVQMLNESRSQWAISRSALDHVAGILETEGKPYLPDGTRPLEQFTDRIEMQGVSFSYEPGQPVLKDVSLAIESGQIVAFVGASGAGKSTLADVLTRFYDPTAGRVVLDGRDLRDYTLDSLRQKIAVVSQSTFLFHDTARANIAYGLEGVSEERIRWAAEKANAMPFIDEMPDGLDTVLGDRGDRISGGQRQRIAIARALLRDPELLILDEATSALDSVSEKLVQESLEYLMRGRTVVVIAHRLSTVENADHVVVLEEGKIAEQGAYDDLLEQRGQLWKYHKIQYQLAD